ncbi:MAG TPA: type II CAAX endopeptidase family protein [Cytophagales bacterium]|nr:type II CAAX endopeptidase family protein [Cytophagales bacterium]
MKTLTNNQTAASIELKPFWNRLFQFNWTFGVVLLFAICVPRFIMVLNANMTGKYGSIGIIMTVSAIVPFIFLSKNGREKIGLTLPTNYTWMFYSFIAGILISTVLFIIGRELYSDTINNWYVYIGKSYYLSEGLNPHDKLIYFLVFATTGMIFSPIGEELFFRGIVHSSFSANFGDKKATIIDSISFALTHLAHFGIVYVSGLWKFLLMPSIFWMLGMFIASLVFTKCKKKTGSIIGAIISHAGFNLSMIYYIFYHL